MDSNSRELFGQRIRRIEKNQEELKEAFELCNKLAKQVKALAVAYEILAEQMAAIVHGQASEPEGPSIIVSGSVNTEHTGR